MPVPLTAPRLLPPASHLGCVACGESAHNPNSLQLQFHSLGSDQVEACFTAEAKWQGYHGQVHGGIISTLLDAAMTHCLFLQGIEAMTAQLEVRFLHPVPLGQPLTIRARVVEQRKRLYRLRAELLGQQAMLAKASASFMQPR